MDTKEKVIEGIRNSRPWTKATFAWHVPPEEPNKRLWHFIKLFPIEELVYCTNLVISDKYEDGDMIPFGAIAFFAP